MTTPTGTTVDARSVRALYDSMSYGPAPEADGSVREWIRTAATDGAFGHYIGGRWVKATEQFEVQEPATGKPLAQVAQGSGDDVNAAVAAARAALPAWQALDDHARARWLYAIARGIQKHARHFAVLEVARQRQADS